ncbi:Gp49 family protein [Methylobacterium nonmethylotrophicum]|uniref:Uncharacterized protein n=1 Tax=Methylobacterium nonmethylotrophicum TaxID=1141884 RepID=A0A4Z0NPI3_9HYPH|nr:Gp49 family protein [Methylobacterium nonmethylotrophicum]TGD98083.1 hypothetical protein EU555_18225 [Methylobacterium nonmethylotrophicum]
MAAPRRAALTAEQQRRESMPTLVRKAQKLQAEPFDGTPAGAARVASFGGSFIKVTEAADGGALTVLVQTPSGVLPVNRGDWVAKSAEDDFYPIVASRIAEQFTIEAEPVLTTGLPALTLPEAQAVVATKTAPRITEDLMREQIATVEYAKLRHLTICVITLKNGFFSDGMSAPADPANYDAAVGERYAFDNAFRKLWPMFGFLLRDRLSGGNTLSSVAGLKDAFRVEGAASVTSSADVPHHPV